MSTTLQASFETRRDAEMAVEHLVQEHGIERADIFISAEGAGNTAGDHLAGSDTESGSPTPESRGDAALNGRITVSVDLDEDSRAADVRAAFGDFNGEDVSQD